jgi:beta-lactam-binding protein with PASTA domain
MIKQSLWMLPFIIFLGSYFITSQIFHVSSVKTPALVGTTIQHALKLLSENNLHPHLLAEKEEADLPDGIILSQIPCAGSSIKMHQTVYCVISKKPDQHITPSFIDTDVDTIKTIANKQNLRIKTYRISSGARPNSCIAQYPCATQPIQTQPIIIYLAKNSQKLIICPGFMGKLLAQATEFLDFHHMAYQIIQSSLEPSQDPLFQSVIDQRPLPGSLIHRDETISIYVK